MSHHSAHHISYAETLYEGDQSLLYSGLMSHHHDINSSESKASVKRILQITLYLSIITVVEVLLGLYGHSAGMPNGLMIFLFLSLTMLKAYYIVKVFMHLGDETKSFQYLVLIPLLLFIWFIIAFLYDGQHWLIMNQTNPVL